MIEWISVKDELPKDKEEVLVSWRSWDLEYEYMERLRFCKNSNTFPDIYPKSTGYLHATNAEYWARVNSPFTSDDAKKRRVKELNNKVKKLHSRIDALQKELDAVMKESANELP